MATVTISDLLRMNLRKAFMDLHGSFMNVMELSEPDVERAKDLFLQLEDKSKRLSEADEKFLKGLENMAADDEEIKSQFEDEFRDMDSFRNMFLTCKLKYQKLVGPSVQEQFISACESRSSVAVVQDQSNVKSRFKLPKIQLYSFDGDIRNWISFWSQFKKIHEDPAMDEEDKFSYLIQCMSVDSRAKSLVDAYPPSKENYSKVIAQLKSRFAKDTLLIEVYVRDLLQLVLETYSNVKPVSVTDLSDKLESKLKALESIGVTSDKYASMLYPLVESALPIELLKLWQRSKISSENEQGDNFNQLNALLEFIKREAAGEQRILLAKNTFNIEQGQKVKANKRRFDSVLAEDAGMATVSTLLSDSTSKRSRCTCIFCDKDHLSQDCFKAIKLSFDERKQLASKHKACFKCLRRGHHAKACKVFVQCLICKRKHFALMCPSNSDKCKSRGAGSNTDKEEPAVAKRESKGGSKSVICLARRVNSNKTFLLTVVVRLFNTINKTVYVRLLFDPASQNSYIVNALGVGAELPVIAKQKICIGLFGGMKTEYQDVNVYEVTFQNVFDESQVFTVELLGQKLISDGIPKLKDKSILKDLESRNIRLSDTQFKNQNIDILLGADLCWKFLTGNIVPIRNNLFAVETKLGWAISGSLSAESQYSVAECLISINLCSPSNFWDLELLGITDPYEHRKVSDLDLATVKNFTETVKRLGDGRYEVNLPWCSDKSLLSSNRFLAEKRLNVVTKRLINLNLYDRYEKVFKEWQDLGIIEEISDDKRLSNCHYLPHHEVVRESSLTTKVRPVFDASARQKGFISLNECLAKGPNLLKTIPPLLVKFRLNRIGFTADIEKAFLQISINEQDRDYVRFLWWNDYQSKTYKLFRHCRVVFGVKPSPFLLNYTINYHLSSDNFPSYLNFTAKELLTSFYVDNLVGSVNDCSEFFKFKQEAIEIMNYGKFNLREWVHSFQEGASVTKVLGLSWDPKLDFIHFNFNFDHPIDLTKRSLLSLIQKLHDPLGLLAPFLLIPKLMFQEICSSKLGWDDKISTEHKANFLKWHNDLTLLDDLKLSRWCFEFHCPTETWSLHVFSDASSKGYAACIYIRGVCDGHVSVRLLMGKSRVAPMKPISIPRLELLGACIGVRMLDSIRESVQVDGKNIYFWSDSSTVLQWLHKDNISSIFVKNRIKEIREFSEPFQWRYVPGEMNPADIASRGCNFPDLTKCSWFNGPEWLKEPPESWPVNIFSFKSEVSEVLLTTANKVSSDVLSSFFTYFSSYDKILNMVAWVRRFSFNIRPQITNKQTGGLSQSELDKAEIFLIKLVQGQVFTESSECLKSLSYFIDENGLYRLKTRLIFEEKKDFRSPIILPKSHIFVQRLVEREHLKMHHAGVTTILANLRERFWIISGRKIIKRVMHNCGACRRFKSKPGSAPVPPLPKFRVECGSAFRVIGIDLCGPLILFNGIKVYVVLFTCAVYRAVHLELVASMSTNSFILAFRRFIARRGRPLEVYTDNGGNFVGTSSLLDAVDWDAVSKDFYLRNITWHFNPPAAPWWGGFWERLIRLVKDLLYRNLGRRSLYFDELHTMICEFESIINQRPLTYVSESADDLCPLRPVDFIQDNSVVEVPDLDFIDANSLRLRNRYLQALRDGLRSRFRKEYISQLLHYSKGKKNNPLKVGEVVLVSDDKIKRFKWPLGKIIRMYKGKDGHFRVAEVKTQSGKLLRPIDRLYPLEMERSDVKD